jgi:GTP:adenosylcobinamide-phosphate guanylyltransferase
MSKQITALIMAANRPGIENPIAKQAGTSHKCLATIMDMTMIERVLRAVRALDQVGHVMVSIEDESALSTVDYITDLKASGDLTIVESGSNLTDSVLKASATLESTDYPLLITTADNVLHTPEIMQTFVDGTEKSSAEVAFGLTPRSVVAEAYPVEAPGVGYLKFADGEHSNCNIYMLRSAVALPAVEALRSGGQFRSNPKRIIKAFGFLTLIKYLLGIVNISDLPKTLDRVFGVSVDAVILPFADAPIDADTLATFALVEKILRAR